MAEQGMTLQDLQAKIAKRAWERPEFEAEFMADPKGTFEKYTGQALPEQVAIFAHYNSPTELHFVLPRRPDGRGDELTDEDLERVAGGEIILTVTTAAYVVVAAAITVVGTITHAEADW